MQEHTVTSGGVSLDLDNSRVIETIGGLTEPSSTPGFGHHPAVLNRRGSAEAISPTANAGSSNSPRSASSGVALLGVLKHEERLAREAERLMLLYEKVCSPYWFL